MSRRPRVTDPRRPQTSVWQARKVADATLVVRQATPAEQAAMDARKAATVRSPWDPSYQPPIVNGRIVL